jgi:hypothetical protein
LDGGEGREIGGDVEESDVKAWGAREVVFIEPVGFAKETFDAVTVYGVFKTAFGDTHEDSRRALFIIVKGMVDHPKGVSEERAAYGENPVNVSLGGESFGFRQLGGVMRITVVSHLRFVPSSLMRYCSRAVTIERASGVGA